MTRYISVRCLEESAGRSTVTLLLAAVLLALGCSSDPAPGPGEPATTGGAGGGPSRFAPLIEAVQAEMAVRGASGAAVAVIEHGELSFAQGFGTKSPGDDQPVEPTSLFRIGSVTKSLTALALLQLVDDGLVDLDALVYDYLPELEIFWVWGADITVRQLLTHTSAIQDYLDPWGDLPGNAEDPLATYVDETMGWWLHINAPPGRMFNYTNSGYIVAGRIIEKLSGQPFEDYLRERVLGPLGLDRSFLDPQEVLADGDWASADIDLERWARAGSGHLVGGPDEYDCVWGRPAAGLFSSVLDLAKYAEFQLHGDPAVLPDELRLGMQSPQVDTELFFDYKHYGYGLFVDKAGFLTTAPEQEPGPFYELRSISHSGTQPGFSAVVLVLPERDFAFVGLSNGDLAHLMSSRAVAIATLVDLPAPAPAPDLTPDTDMYATYAGNYWCPPCDMDLIVGIKSGNLVMDVPGWAELGGESHFALEWAAPHVFDFEANQGDLPARRSRRGRVRPHALVGCRSCRAVLSVARAQAVRAAPALARGDAPDHVGGTARRHGFWLRLPLPSPEAGLPGGGRLEHRPVWIMNKINRKTGRREELRTQNPKSFPSSRLPVWFFSRKRGTPSRLSL